MELCGTCSHRLEVGGLDEDITAGLLVYGPAQRAQRRHEGLDRGRKNGELGKAERLRQARVIVERESYDDLVAKHYQLRESRGRA